MKVSVTMYNGEKLEVEGVVSSNGNFIAGSVCRPGTKDFGQANENGIQSRIIANGDASFFSYNKEKNEVGQELFSGSWRLLETKNAATGDVNPINDPFKDWDPAPARKGKVQLNNLRCSSELKEVGDLAIIASLQDMKTRAEKGVRLGRQNKFIEFASIAIEETNKIVKRNAARQTQSQAIQVPVTGQSAKEIMEGN